jgi:cytochrome c oxidase cbb3-type subunit 3
MMRYALGTLLLTGLAALSSHTMAADADTGEHLYQVYCTQCHGIGGDGKGINIPDMTVLPRDHTDTGEMSARTDKELIKAIKHGGKAVNKSVLMPAWDKNLSDEQVDDLVAYLRHICCEK